MSSLPAAADVNRPYNDQLTALRGIACLCVLLGHVIQVFNYHLSADTSVRSWAASIIRGLFNAEGAVLLFFVLSGCVLAMSFNHAKQLGWNAVAGFYVKRVFRLYPLLWLSTFVAIAGVLVARTAPAGVFVPWLQTNLQAQVTLAHSLLSMAGVWTKYDGPMWSLRVELLYSALFPAIYLLVSNPRTRLWFIVALLLLALLPVAHPQYGTAFGISFGLGALIPCLPRGTAKPHGLVVLAAVIALCYDRGIIGAYGPPDIIYDLIETIASFVIVRDIHSGCRDYRLLSFRPLVRIGDLSFSLYLLHLPILLIIFTVLRHFAGVSTLLGHPAFTQIVLGAATISVTMALSYVTYTCMESPLHHFGRRLAARIARKQLADKTIGKGVAAGLTPTA